MTSVVWVNDGTSYLVSSLNHLRCIAAKGSGFSASGSVPSYMSATYKQTANIDCSGQTMIPIGDSSTPFTGNYDGNGYEIQNWQNNQSSTSQYQGLFGYINNESGVIKNLIINGICKLKGTNNCGFLIGYARISVSNIILNLSNGSVINCNAYSGGLIGSCCNTTNSQIIEKILITGYLTINYIGDSVGGIVGNVTSNVAINVIIRDAIYSPIGDIITSSTSGGFIGGICGALWQGTLKFYGCINAMTGSMYVYNQKGGGILGYGGTNDQSTSLRVYIYACLNKMKGSLYYNATTIMYGCAGIAGSCTNGEYEDNMNIMTGNIPANYYNSSNPAGYYDNTGGFGDIRNNDASMTFKRNVIAINGKLLNIANGGSGIIFSPNKAPKCTYANNIFSNRFGMKINNDLVTTDSLNIGTSDTLNSYPSNLTTNGYFKEWDTVNNIPIWIYTYTDINNVQRTIRSDASTSYVPINWVLNNGYYEVSSLNHLRCIAAKGSGYATTGSIPSNYMTATYKQTANIDCNGITMTPIGDSTTQFSGSYDGQGFEIQNWQNDQSSTADYQGIFGYNSGSTIINIYLTGLCKVKGNNYIGILIGRTVNVRLYNIITNFSNGSVVNGGNSYVGGLIGQATNGNYESIMMNGYLTLSSIGTYLGGMIGYYSHTTAIVVNLVISTIGNITNTISAGIPAYVGGIFGYFGTTQASTVLYGFKNEIIGNITSTGYYIGGIAGYTSLSVPLNACVNRMKGDITGSSYVGGIVGMATNNICDSLNIMEGNIASVSNSGAIGYLSNTGTSSQRNVIAMKGNTPAILFSGATNNTNTVFSNRFGMTVGLSIITSSTQATYVTLDSYPTILSGGVLKYWDYDNNVPVWFYQHNEIINNTIIYIFSYKNKDITWILSNGYYQVSSIDHLRCISTRGLGFNCSGTVPTNFMTANYKQTVNIDCYKYIMCSIGNSALTYTGIYDGQGFEIQNWANIDWYLQGTMFYQKIGLFGSTSNNIIKNITITGIVKVYADTTLGILIGDSNNTNISNIILNLSNGSSINCNGSYVGGLIGVTNNGCIIENIRVYGYLTINSVNGGIGGIVGQAYNTTFRDIIYAPIGNITTSGTNQGNVGGISGYTSSCNFYGCINAMTGNIRSYGYLSGITGLLTGTNYIKACVNKMNGSFISNSISTILNFGGIFNSDSCAVFVEDCMNLMNGSMPQVSTGREYSEGGIGNVTNVNDSSYIKRCLVAMKGNIGNTYGFIDPRYKALNTNNVFSNRFGMTLNNSVSITDSTNNGTYVTLDSFPSQLLGGYFTEWDSTNYLPIWIYSYTDINSNLRTIRSDHNVNLVINWIYDNNYYMVSSKDHFNCIINKGSIYTCSGIYPNNFYNANYKQTVNINLNNSYSSIGKSNEYYSGIYDGLNNQIQNITINTNSNINYGLFNNINNAIIKNLSITGNLNIQSNLSTGILVHTASNNCIIDNCKVIASGTINVNSNLSLICNNFYGSNNVINKCYTQFIGTIKTNNTNASNPSGIILGNSLNSNNYVVYCTNENIGDTYLGTYYGGGIAGSNVNVYGCINKMTGNLYGHSTSNSYYIGGIAGDANVNCCINDMTGNIGLSNNNSYFSGISGKGTINNSINCMTGNINTNSGYGISKDAVITNSYNYMKGSTFDVIGGNIGLSSNNYVASMGNSYNIVNTSYSNYFGTTTYGFSNNNAKISIRNDPWNIFTGQSNFIYLDAIRLPILSSNLTISINNSNYSGMASNWEISFPSSTYKEFKYKYNTITSKYILYTKNYNNEVESKTPINLTNTIIPVHMYNIIQSTDIDTYSTTITNIINSTSNNIKTVEEAIIYQTLSNQKATSNLYDFSTFNEPISQFKELYKPAIKNVLLNSLESNNKKVLKNLDNSLFDVIVKERTTDKLLIPSNIKLEKTEVESLFSNQTDLLLLDNTVYTIDLDGPIIEIDTNETTVSNIVKINYNNSNYTLSTSNTGFEIEYAPNQWKFLNITGFGSASIEAINLTNLVYQQDTLNNYLITQEDEFICIANEGYGYHVVNAPINYNTVNYLQESNLNFELRSNIMIDGPFYGVFDGNNKELQNLNYYSIGFSNYALFNTIENAVIKNIVITSNLNVSGSNVNYGGIIYKASNNSLIDNCKVIANGSINIGGSMSLICNNTEGQYTVINNCLTNYTGNITCSNNSGSLLGLGAGYSNTYVLFSTNKNVGNFTGQNYIGGLVGSNATIYGSVNLMQGNINSSSNCGGLAFDANCVSSINAMVGHINNSNTNCSNVGGITSSGSVNNCFNSMIGNIYGFSSNCGGISYNALTTNSLNVMKGNVNGYALGSNVNNSNNICAMYGKASMVSSNISYNYAITDYGFDNSVSKLKTISANSLSNYIKSSNDIEYDINSSYMPYFTSNVMISVNGSNYNLSNEYFNTYYPNITQNISTLYNYYARRTIDNILTKGNVSSYTIDNILYLVNNYSNKLLVSFTFEENNFIKGNIGIGTDNPLRTLDIRGDLKVSGDIYKDYTKLGNWYYSESNIYYNSGNVGINKNPSYTFDIAGVCRVKEQLTNSDIRLKTNVNEEQLGLDYISQLQPKVFKYISNEELGLIHGFIAQDILMSSNADIVDTDNEYYSIDTMNLIGPIIKSLKELVELQNSLSSNV